MQAELAKWNNGNGTDLETWVGCMGNFSLTVGYTTIFWPEFVEVEGYIFRGGVSLSALIKNLRQYEKDPRYSKKSIEWVMNHLHVVDIHYGGCEDVSSDKLVIIGNTLKEIYSAKLKSQFPNNPCTVEFYIPEDINDLSEYQVSFWQTKHE